MAHETEDRLAASDALVLLERLFRVERAVFLLREVFEYEYAEIACTVGKDDTNCRQILRRAHQHMAEVRP